MIRKSGCRFSEKIMLDEIQSAMEVQPNPIALWKLRDFRANHSYPVLNGFGHRSYPIIFNLNDAVSYRDRRAGRTVNTDDLC